MAINSYTTTINHTTDASFRQWGLDFSNGLTAVGLVQTADTGQINWTTVTRPAINVSAGYEIRRSADSTIYYKFEFGTAGTATFPQMWITVGQSSNGTGTLTGQLSTRNIWTSASAPISTTTPYSTFMSASSDMFGVVWGQNGFATGAVAPGGVLVVGKTVDNSGLPTTIGYSVIRQVAQTNFAMQSVRITTTATTFTESTFFSIVPGAVTTSVSAGNNQAYLMWGNHPEVLPFLYSTTVVAAEVPENTTFSVALIGATPHTYLCVGGLGTTNIGPANNNATTYSLAFLYE